MSVEKAKDISDKYKQLKYCCGIVSDINSDEDRTSVFGIELHGWRMTKYEVDSAGIDSDLVYQIIEKLAKSKKLELEKELGEVIEDKVVYKNEAAWYCTRGDCGRKLSPGYSKKDANNYGVECHVCGTLNKFLP